LWVAAALLALLTARLSPALPLAVAATAALITLTNDRVSTRSRLAFAAAYGPIAFAADAPAVAWVGAAALLGLAMTAAGPAESSEAGLLRHLERVRRRGEEASVMVLRMPRARASRLRDLQRRLRVADSARLVRGVSADEIHVVMEGELLDEPAVEARLGLDEIPDVSFGWARFPRDGGSLEVLVETARECASAGDELPTAAVPDRAFLRPAALEVE
jgi:hypothetical protein